MVGAMVAARRIQSGMGQPANPRMMTSPTVVPTIERDRPETRSETAPRRRAGARAYGKRSVRLHTTVGAIVKQGGGHLDHIDVDQRRQAGGDHDVEIEEANKLRHGEAGTTVAPAVPTASKML